MSHSQSQAQGQVQSHSRSQSILMSPIGGSLLRRSVVSALASVAFLLPMMSLAADDSSAASTSKQSRGNSFNPDISLNALMLYRNGNRGNDRSSTEPNGFSLQEAELQFTADVDPYWRLVGLFSVPSEYDPATGTYEYSFEPEEAFAETISLPLATIRAGKFKAAFGRHNTLHAHAFPFIDEPLIQRAFLGDEGLNDVGVSAAILVPAPWFSEITLQALSGHSEGVTQFASTSPNSFVPLVHLKNLWDLSDESTVEFGLSGASGKNSTDETTDIFGVDLTFKWRPVLFGTSRSFIWSTEAIQRNFKRPDSKEEGQGFVTYAQLQFAQQWWAQARTEYLEVKDSDPANTIENFSRKSSALVAYVPSEFSSLRVQYDHLTDVQEKAEQKVSLQLNFSIGAHPAHMY